MGVAVSAAAATYNKNSLVGFSEVVQQFAGVVIVSGGAEWNSDFQVFAVVSAAVAAFTMAAALRTKCMIEPELQQCVFVRVRCEVDTAAVPAIPATWTASWHELLSAERYGTMPAVPGL